MIPLGTEDAAEIIAALSAITAAAPEPPLPRSVALFANLRDRLREGRGVALLRGLAPDQAPGGAEALLGLLARHLGIPASAEGVLAVEQLAGEANGFFAESCDIVALLCMRPVPEGQVALLASAGALHNAMLLEDRALLAELYDALAMVEAEGLTAYPVFTQTENGFAGRFDAEAIAAAEQAPHQATLSGRQRAAMEMLTRLAADSDFGLRLDMRPGDLLCFNPRRVWLRRMQRVETGLGDFLLMRMRDAV